MYSYFESRRGTAFFPISLPMLEGCPGADEALDASAAPSLGVGEPSSINSGLRVFSDKQTFDRPVTCHWNWGATAERA